MAVRRRPMRAPLIVLVVVLGLLGSSCGADDPGQEVRAQLARSPGEPSTLAGTVRALNQFGADVFRGYAGTPGNLALSPPELGRSLAMARAGSVGTTRMELERVLHADRSPDLDRGFTTIDELIGSRAGERRTPTRKGTVEFDRGATLWVPRGTRLRDDFLGVLATDYGAGARTVDFRADPEAARRSVNLWAQSVTQGNVSELVPRGLVTDYTRMLLASTFSLRAAWQEPFAHAGTAPAPFQLDDGGTVVVPTMSTEGPRTLGYAHTDQWDAVELPYLSGELAMVVVVPAAGTTRQWESNLDGDGLDAIVASLQPTPVDLSLPRFQFTSELRLDDTLRVLGLSQAQSDGDAEFSAITGDEPLAVSAVIQQTYAAAGENGSGGQVGGIAVQAPAGASTTPGVVLDVDRPFVFAVIDRQSGLVLSLGRVRNPLG